MGAGTPPRIDLTALPDEVKELVRAQLEAVRFQSVDEVVCEALRLLHEREELFASHREELRAQIAEGVVAEERGELRDGGDAIADVRRRIDERLRRGE
jgi:putative addiction module CopG family antidote